MQTAMKSRLNIGVSSAQKAKLAEAAMLQNIKVSQFVLNSSLDAAEQVIAEQGIIRESKPEYDWLMAELDKPPCDIPALRKLLNEPSIFES